MSSATRHEIRCIPNLIGLHLYAILARLFREFYERRNVFHWLYLSVKARRHTFGNIWNVIGSSDQIGQLRFANPRFVALDITRRRIAGGLRADLQARRHRGSRHLARFRLITTDGRRRTWMDGGEVAAW